MSAAARDAGARDPRTQQQGALPPTRNVDRIKHATCRRRRASTTCLASARTQLPGRRRRAGLPALLPARATLAAQLFGTVRRDQPGASSRRRATAASQQGTIVGQDGLEYTYDRYLRGERRRHARPGRRARPPEGRRCRASASPCQGKQLKLSLDLDLQRAGQQAHAEAGRAAIADGAKTGRRLRGDGPAQRRGPRAWAPTRASTRTSSPSRSRRRRYDAAQQRGERRAAVQPRDRRRSIRPARRSSRSPRWRRCECGHRSRPTRRSTTPASFKIGDHEFQQRRRRGRTARSRCATRCRSPRTSSSTTLGAQLNATAATIAPEVGAPARPRPPHRHRPAGRVRRAGPRPRVARRGRRVPKCRKKRKAPTRRCTRAAASSAWTRATTSTSPSARATCRPRRCRWPSPTRRSPTAARSCARTSACAIEDAAGRLLQEHRARRRARTRQDRPGLPRRRSSTACTRAASEPGGTSADVFAGFGRTRCYGKTGTAERAGQRRPVLVRRLRRPTRTRADRGRRDRRAGRLRRRDRRARPRA